MNHSLINNNNSNNNSNMKGRERPITNSFTEQTATKLRSNLTRSTIDTTSNTTPIYNNNINTNYIREIPQKRNEDFEFNDDYIYRPSSSILNQQTTNMTTNSGNNTSRRYQQLRNQASSSTSNMQRSFTPNHQPSINISVQHQHRCYTPQHPPQNRSYTPSHQLYNQFYPTKTNIIQNSAPASSSTQYHHSYRDDGQSMHSILSTLSRSAVDITADGKVLRMCTLILNPDSSSPVDAEFGFDLVTKVKNTSDILNASYNDSNYMSTIRSASTSYGDYFIDTVDDMSPANLAGLKSGDKLVEVDGIDVKNKTFEEVNINYCYL